MQTQKMSLANIQGKLSRNEMKKIMAGSGESCSISASCSVFYSGNTYFGECGLLNGHCKCVTDLGDYQPASNGGVSRCGWL